ncbi:translocation protein SEC62, putative [Ixodes scapularis]|uniref:Translocation protein SEC62 n=1 Tax=Ixodes scapularis TaxID=6945 RepID=B7PTN0_IXOSC|nr:translocation protein SEC62, putative [Ixodes scapularis]|eukprot:XP_002404722.1 translocation protein SEC62, putative [Ixodes scapularis]
MSQVERKKSRKKREKDVKKPSKVEYDVARYLRDKLPVKKTTLLSHKVEYFNAAKAVDCLLESPWATGKPKYEQLFTTRESVVDYMDLLLQHKFFHRAKKIIVTKTKKKKEEEGDGGTPKAARERRARAEGDEGAKDSDDRKVRNWLALGSSSFSSFLVINCSETLQKKKKNIFIKYFLDLVCFSSRQPFVWIYDPVPLKAWIVGTLLVVGAVAVCLFPLWPRTVRDYVYYLSIVTAFLLGIIISLAFLRHVLFVVIWAVTLGRHHFWLLPNLTEDVGFLDSFWPIYQYEYRGPAKAADEDGPPGDDDAKPDQPEAGDGNGFELLDHPDKEKQS